MKKVEFFTITIITIAYVIFSLIVSSILVIVNNKVLFSAPSRDELAIIGAFVAFYHVFWNLYKYVRENIISKSLVISGILTYNSNEMEIECSFLNKGAYPITIDFCFLKGISFDFESLKLESNSIVIKKIKGKRIPEIKLEKNLFRKSNVKFSYKIIDDLSKYKIQKLKIDMRCIE